MTYVCVSQCHQVTSSHAHPSHSFRSQAGVTKRRAFMGCTLVAVMFFGMHAAGHVWTEPRANPICFGNLWTGWVADKARQSLSSSCVRPCGQEGPRVQTSACHSKIVPRGGTDGHAQYRCFAADDGAEPMTCPAPASVQVHGLFTKWSPHLPHPQLPTFRTRSRTASRGTS